MSSFCARPLGDRIAIIHEMADRTVISELDIQQAALLLQQLRAALGKATATIRESVLAI